MDFKVLKNCVPEIDFVHVSGHYRDTNFQPVKLAKVEPTNSSRVVIIFYYLEEFCITSILLFTGNLIQLGRFYSILEKEQDYKCV